MMNNTPPRSPEETAANASDIQTAAELLVSMHAHDLSDRLEALARRLADPALGEALERLRQEGEHSYKGDIAQYFKDLHFVLDTLTALRGTHV